MNGGACEGSIPHLPHAGTTSTPLCILYSAVGKEGVITHRVARENVASAKKKPLKIIHVAGEKISMNPKEGKLSIRGKDGEVEIYPTDKTIIRIGGERSSLSDITAKNRTAVKYLELDGKKIARSIFITHKV
jgi:hypothetical protein